MGDVAPGLTGCGKRPYVGKPPRRGTDNHPGAHPDSAHEFFRSLLSPACAALKGGATFKLRQHLLWGILQVGYGYPQYRAKSIVLSHHR